jgi:hypothetical protein
MKCEHNFKSEVMPIYNIITHVRGTDYEKPHYYILNKGLNSGKPNKEPYTNSFVVLCNSEQELEDLFWISYSLWKCKFWHQFLIGSVIPFIRIGDLRKELILKSKLAIEHSEEYKKQIRALQLIEERENQYKKELILMENIKKAILYNFFK